MNKFIGPVVIPVYNRKTLVEHTLKGLMKQSISNISYEVILVDDCSDEPLTYLKDKYPISFIRLEKNCGIATARNRGIELAKGERILFLDGDLVPDLHLLESHLMASMENASNTVVVGYRYDLVYSDSKYAIEHQDMKPDGREFFYLTNTCNLAVWPAPWQVAHGNNLSVPRQLIEKVGRFDENFRTYGIEDYEFCYRLYKYGADFKLSRNAITFHQLHERDDELEFVSEFKNLKYFLNKHPSFDIEILFARFGYSESKKQCIDNYQVQQSIRDILNACANYNGDWKDVPDLANVTRPCAVLCSGNQYQSDEEWFIFHPSQQERLNSSSLLGIELPYPSGSFSSVLLTSVTLKLLQFLPAMVHEAFRLAPKVWLELPNLDDIDLTALAKILNCIIHLPSHNGRLCLLEPIDTFYM